MFFKSEKKKSPPTTAAATVAIFIVGWYTHRAVKRNVAAAACGGLDTIYWAGRWEVGSRRAVRLIWADRLMLCD